MRVAGNDSKVAGSVGEYGEARCCKSSERSRKRKECTDALVCNGECETRVNHQFTLSRGYNCKFPREVLSRNTHQSLCQLSSLLYIHIYANWTAVLPT